jgi:hypothetical protein
MPMQFMIIARVAIRNLIKRIKVKKPQHPARLVTLKSKLRRYSTLGFKFQIINKKATQLWVAFSICMTIGIDRHK